MSTPWITSIPNVQEFITTLQNNPGLIILKFGAEWCGPCKRIESHVHKWFATMPSCVQCGLIDVDENFELYGFLRSKRQINGIPALFCYYKGNTSYIPNATVAGTDVGEIDAFFQRSLQVLL